MILSWFDLNLFAKFGQEVKVRIQEQFPRNAIFVWALLIEVFRILCILWPFWFPLVHFCYCDLAGSLPASSHTLLAARAGKYKRNVKQIHSGSPRNKIHRKYPKHIADFWEVVGGWNRILLPVFLFCEVISFLDLLFLLTSYQCSFALTEPF